MIHSTSKAPKEKIRNSHGGGFALKITQRVVTTALDIWTWGYSGVTRGWHSTWGNYGPTRATSTAMCHVGLFTFSFGLCYRLYNNNALTQLKKKSQLLKQLIEIKKKKKKKKKRKKKGEWVLVMSTANNQLLQNSNTYNMNLLLESKSQLLKWSTMDTWLI